MSEPVIAFREHALLLGDSRSLVGVHCVPAQASGMRAVTVVILNSGIIHRVGANRMHVELARSLAAQGFPTLRFDLSGIGDSLQRTDELSLIDGVIADIRTALDHLSAVRPGASFVLVGLCSGAMHALVYGATDARVKGLVLLDLLIPRTKGYWMRHVLRRLSSASAWRKFLTGKSSLFRHQANVPLAPDLEQPEDLFPMSLVFAALAERFHAVVKRNTQMLAVFTAGLENQHNYRSQMLDGFSSVDFTRGLQLEYFQETDHTFSSEHNRRRLIDTISTWLNATPALQLKLETHVDAGPAGAHAAPANGVTANAAHESSDAREDLEF